MKYLARVRQVLRSGIHSVGELRDGQLHRIAELPTPDRVEIEMDDSPESACMMYRYTDTGAFCGDTWHATFADALAQAEFEYGLSSSDFQPTASQG